VFDGLSPHVKGREIIIGESWETLLGQDWPGVNTLINLMHRDTATGNAGIKSPAICVHSRKFRKDRRMDVDDSKTPSGCTPKSRKKIWGKDPQVTCQKNPFGVPFGNCLQNQRFMRFS